MTLHIVPVDACTKVVIWLCFTNIVFIITQYSYGDAISFLLFQLYVRVLY